MKIFEEERPASMEDVSWLRRAMARRLSDLRLPAEIVDDLQLVISEVAANAVIHGRPRPTTLTVKVELRGVDLTISIIDNGGAFIDGNKKLTPTPSDLDHLSISGRGLALVSAALDRASFEYSGKNCFFGRRNLQRRQPTALVVEDTPALLDVYIQTLQQDYRVVGCSSFEDARAILREQTIDVVLADVHLGDGLGVELPEEIANIDSGSLPVVLISADTSPQTQEAALRLGAEFYLPKPVRAKDLRDTVALALSRAAIRDARLARRFARHVDGFIASSLPTTIGQYRVATAAGTPSAGGGDLVLHLPMDQGARLVVIDVMGHGVAARAWAVAYAAIIRSVHLCSSQLSAARFLDELARIAWNEPILDQALATVLIVDLHANGAEISTAGHPPPLVLSKRMPRVSAVNALLGVMPPEPHSSDWFDLKPGDRLVLFTDGLDPSGVAAGDDPPDWFMTAVADARHEPLALGMEKIRRATESALGPQPQDDWTFIVVERSANG